MADWGMYELEDIVWDKFAGSDDHIVPHPGGTDVSDSVHEGVCHKKSWSEAASAAAGKSTDGKTSVTKNVLQGKDKTTFHSTLVDGKAPVLEKGSWSHVQDNVFSASCESDCISLATGLTPEDAKTSSNCFKSSNVDSVGNEFCTDASILGNGGAVVDNNLCHFQLDDISAAESDLEFFGNGRDQKESSDLLDYGWPDIGNFEDVDRMFRNCDSTFGQGNSSTANELLWFSTSSHANDHSEDTYKSGFGSSYSEGRVLNSTPEHVTDPKYMPASDHLAIADCDKEKCSSNLKKGSWNSDANDYCTYANWFDADTENKGESASIVQAQGDTGSHEVKISPQTPISNASSVTGCQGTALENMQSKQSKSQKQLEGKRKVKSSKDKGTLHGSGAVQQFSDRKLPSSVPSSSQVLYQQRQPCGTNSFRYLHAYTPYGHQEYGHPPHQFPVMPTVSCVKSETKNHPPSYKIPGHTSNNVPRVEISPNPLLKLSNLIPEEKVMMLDHAQQLQTAMCNEHQHDQFMCHATFADQVPVWKQLHQIQDEVGADSEVEETGMEFAAAEIDSSTVQESSCMSSVLSNEISQEATSFRQLQDAMDQFDIRTKLCIRDSLYRLARSAEQRHNFCKRNSSSRDKRGRSGTSASEESNKCLGFMDPETDTNPIDRSIAHLLFYKPSGPSSRPSNDASSLQSNVIIHGSMTNQPAMHDQLVYQEDIADDTDMKLPITEQ